MTKTASHKPPYRGPYPSPEDWIAPKGPPDKGAFKDDKGKPPVYQGFLAYFPRAIKEVALVSDYGKKKYNAEFSDKGFLKLEAVRYSDACVRHMLDEAISGEALNAEDGYVRHKAQVAWDALADLEITLINEESGTFSEAAVFGSAVQEKELIPLSPPAW